MHEDNKIRSLKAFYLTSNATQKPVWVNPLQCFSAGIKQSWKEQDRQQLQLWTLAIYLNFDKRISTKGACLAALEGKT